MAVWLFSVFGGRWCEFFEQARLAPFLTNRLEAIAVEITSALPDPSVAAIFPNVRYLQLFDWSWYSGDGMQQAKDLAIFLRSFKLLTVRHTILCSCCCLCLCLLCYCSAVQ